MCRFYDKKQLSIAAEGYLNITTVAEKTKFLAKDDKTLKYKPAFKNFTSGMVQSWNKFCFTGGIMEVWFLTS
jgi:beta-glucan synthesis-associated protein KRE6